MVVSRRKFLSLSTNIAAALAARHALANGLLPLGGAAVANNFALTSLQTGINNGLVFSDDTGGTCGAGGNCGTWMTDGTGGFGRLNYVAGGTSGFRWQVSDQSKTGIYIQYDLRWNSADQVNNTKEIKVFSKNYPTKYSNFTGGCNTGGYTGNQMGLSYSDNIVTGGDINTQFLLYQFPTLTGGSSYTQPQPRSRVVPTQVASQENTTGVWQTIAHWYQQNSDGNADGEYAIWKSSLTSPLLWIDQMTNTYVGGQGFLQVDLGG